MNILQIKFLLEKKNMPHKSNPKAVKALKEITSKAKKIRKEHPSMQWKTAIKEASAEYRKKK